jgi:hypothetical protein
VSNIVPFPKNRLLGGELRAIQQEKLERQKKAGGQAYKNLSTWRGRIPPEDRVQLGKNMHRIITDYNVRTAELQWREDYASAQSFRVDLHRMGVTGNLPKTRDLVASPYKWLRLLAYVQRWLRARRLSVTLEHLADRLTRSTRFHPTKKLLTRAEKLQILLSGWADRVNNEFNLLQTFSEISVLRAEFFRRNYGDIYWPDCHDGMRPPEWGATFDQLLKFDRTVPYGLLDRQISELTVEDWDTILKALPEDQLGHYEYVRDQVLEYKRPFDPRTAMWGSFRDVAFDWDISVLPHWFIGFRAYTDLSNAPGVDQAERFQELGTVDPFVEGSRVDWEWDCSYLVLYPEEGFTRLVPYIFRYAEEATTFFPLDDEDFSEYGDRPFVARYFPPKPANEVAVARSLLVRLEESLEEVLEAWRRTAPNVKKHPYFAWRATQDIAVETAIERLMTPYG